jgi:hypothetical protein
MTTRIEKAIAELADAINDFQHDEDPQSREMTTFALRAFVRGQLDGWFTTMIPPDEYDGPLRYIP